MRKPLTMAEDFRRGVAFPGAFAVVAALGFSSNAIAQSIQLGMPIACEPGRTCYIQNYAEKQLAKLQQEVAKMNSSATQQQYQQQLTQAQSLLDTAVQAIQSGNFDTGMHDAKQAMDLMQQVAQGIRGAFYAQYIQTKIEPRLAELQQKAQKANLTSSVSQQVQSQLSQAKSLLDGAIQSFLSGNFKAGGEQVQHAIQLMQQVMQEIASSTHHP